MRTKAKVALVIGTLATAAALAVPALGSDAPFPMNPWPGSNVDYALYVETLLGHGSKVKPPVYCAQSSVFRRGYQIVFRMYIVNAHTGKVLTGKDLSKVLLRIPGVKDISVPFRPQGGTPDATSPWLWSTAWLVPSDYPLGKFTFSVVAKVKRGTDKGKSVTFKPQVPGTEWDITP